LENIEEGRVTDVPSFPILLSREGFNRPRGRMRMPLSHRPSHRGHKSKFFAFL